MACGRWRPRARRAIAGEGGGSGRSRRSELSPAEPSAAAAGAPGALAEGARRIPPLGGLAARGESEGGGGARRLS
jgi:hypothetical protein